MKIAIERSNPLEDKFGKLIKDLEAELAEAYPAEACHWDDQNVLAAENVVFLAAFEEPDSNRVEPIGIGAVKFLGDYAEIKRLYVPSKWRGNGIAAELMRNLEREVENEGIKVIRVETGIHQKGANKLYQNKLGYKERGPFGDYLQHPLSVFLEKRLP